VNLNCSSVLIGCLDVMTYLSDCWGLIDLWATVVVLLQPQIQPMIEMLMKPKPKSIKMTSNDVESGSF
jgi:hypothetical protein